MPETNPLSPIPLLSPTSSIVNPPTGQDKLFRTLGLIAAVFLLIGLVLAAYQFSKTQSASPTGNSEPKTAGPTTQPAVTSSVVNPTANWKTYTDIQGPNPRFQFKYPENWEALEIQSAGVVLRPLNDQTPAQIGLEFHSIPDPQQLYLSQLCSNNNLGKDPTRLEVAGLLCSKDNQSNTHTTSEINNIKWEKLEKGAVGLVPSGFVIYDTPHQKELFFVSGQSNLTEETQKILDQILSTFTFLDQNHN